MSLDDFFSGHKVSEIKKEHLKNAGYWGCLHPQSMSTKSNLDGRNYNLNSEGVCHRTQVAVRNQTTNLARWKRFVRGKVPDRDHEESKADAYIVKHILQVYYQEADRAIRCLDGIGDAIPAGVRATLIYRWKQIQTMVRAAFKNGIKDSVQTSTLDIFDLPLPAMK